MGIFSSGACEECVDIREVVEEIHKFYKDFFYSLTRRHTPKEQADCMWELVDAIDEESRKNGYFFPKSKSRALSDIKKEVLIEINKLIPIIKEQEFEQIKKDIEEMKEYMKEKAKGKKK